MMLSLRTKTGNGHVEGTVCCGRFAYLYQSRTCLWGHSAGFAKYRVGVRKNAENDRMA